MGYYICNLSFLKKVSPTHTHLSISIDKFLKPYNLLFLESESFIKVNLQIQSETPHLKPELKLKTQSESQKLKRSKNYNFPCPLKF